MKKLISLILLISIQYLSAQVSTQELPNEISAKLKCLNPQYLVHSPSQSSSPKPLLIFLHGIGKRGNDVNQLKAMMRTVSKHSKNHDMLTVMPQCAKNEQGKGWWVSKDLTLLLEHLKQSLNIDQKKIYLVGFSMGGFGTWDWAMEQPDTFAAIAPLAGGSRISKVKKIKDLQIWAFHGEKDKTVPYSKTKTLVDALKKAGSKTVKFTTLKKQGHGIVMPIMKDPKLYEWLAQQKK